MSDSNLLPPCTGFSTGALECGDYRTALEWLKDTPTDTVEISALRFAELRPLVSDLENLPTDQFKIISFHTPSSFAPELEEEVVELLKPVHRRGWNIVVHPDVIRRPSLWKIFGGQLLIENMDRRKSTGRTVAELDDIFALLPEARLCLDVAHARQLDTTLTLLFRLIRHFANRIAEIHISELDSHCRHVPMSWSAVKDYQSLPWSIIGEVPVIIESILETTDRRGREKELALARKAVTRKVENVAFAATCACYLPGYASSPKANP